MAAAPFTPPRYTETHRYIFDRKTGEILATEARWADEGAESAEEINTDLVRRVAKDSGRVEGDVDVLQAPKGTSQGHVRVGDANAHLRPSRSRQRRDATRTTRATLNSSSAPAVADGTEP
jgi:hypothetical protein